MTSDIRSHPSLYTCTEVEKWTSSIFKSMVEIFSNSLSERALVILY